MIERAVVILLLFASGACGGNGKTNNDAVTYAAHCECQCVVGTPNGTCPSETFAFCLPNAVDETTLVSIFSSLCTGKITSKVRTCALSTIDPNDTIGSTQITATPIGACTSD